VTEETAAPAPQLERVPAPAPPAAEERSSISEWTITILLLLFGTTALVQAFVIPTGSMEDTLLIGDHLLVDKVSYAPSGPVSKYFLPYTPIRRGDIVVFRYPMQIRENFVKRVVGVPGDRLRIENKTLFLNGRPLKEPYKSIKSDYLQSYRDFFPGEPNVPLSEPALQMLEQHVVDKELVVPPNSYFVMGDNRDNSSDSRYWGFVPRENVFGKPFLIYWSYDAPTARLAGSFSLEHIKDLATNFFTKTRWRRTFQLVRGEHVE
jgi:signal peptidase I